MDRGALCCCIFYCVKLKNNADPEKLTSQYAIEENRDSAEHQGDPVFDEAEVLDIGEGGLTVPLSDVSDEDRDEE